MELDQEKIILLLFGGGFVAYFSEKFLTYLKLKGIDLTQIDKIYSVAKHAAEFQEKQVRSLEQITVLLQTQNKMLQEVENNQKITQKLDVHYQNLLEKISEKIK